MIKEALGIVTFVCVTAGAVAGCEDDSTGGGTNCTANCSTVDASSSNDASPHSDGGATQGAAGYCDIQPSQCIDYDTYDAPSAAKGCELIHGTYSASGTCPHATSPGGCKQTFANGSVTTTWYYAPTTADDVTAQCKNDANAVFVAP
jgi:hypothetical protein